MDVLKLRKNLGLWGWQLFGRVFLLGLLGLCLAINTMGCEKPLPAEAQEQAALKYPFPTHPHVRPLREKGIVAEDFVSAAVKKVNLLLKAKNMVGRVDLRRINFLLFSTADEEVLTPGLLVAKSRPGTFLFEYLKTLLCEQGLSTSSKHNVSVAIEYPDACEYLGIKQQSELWFRVEYDVNLMSSIQQGYVKVRQKPYLDSTPYWVGIGNVEFYLELLVMLENPVTVPGSQVLVDAFMCRQMVLNKTSKWQLAEVKCEELKAPTEDNETRIDGGGGVW